MQLKECRDTFLVEVSERYNREEAGAIFGLLLEDLLGLERFEWVKRPGYVLGPSQAAAFELAMYEIISGRPVQYVTGKAHFLELELYVRDGVLIPRPETEELVLILREKEAAYRHQRIKVVDLGTGSGAIALALSKSFPVWEVFGLDRCSKALDIARENAGKTGLPVTFASFDVLSPASWPRPEEEGVPAWEGFGILVSNPPYVPEREREFLEEHVREHEPGEALFVPDSDPLLFYRGLIELSVRFGGEEVRIFAECHCDYAERVAGLWRSYGLDRVGLFSDSTGKKRFVAGTYFKKEQ